MLQLDETDKQLLNIVQGAFPGVPKPYEHLGLQLEISEDEVMVAIVVAEGARFDPAALFGFCAETMPRFAVPRYLRAVASLPKTPSQRIQKYLLRAEGITADTVDRRTLGIEPERS